MHSIPTWSSAPPAAVECVQMGHIPRMRPASDTIDPGGRREIETYGVIERTADGAIERKADGLNPLTINHTAKTISWRPIGALRTLFTVVKPKSWVKPVLTVATKFKAPPTRPQPDSHRGMSLDL